MHAVLDLDGTLLDARPRQVAVAAAVVREAGHEPLDGDAFWSLKRGGATTAGALERLGYADAAALAARWQAQVEDDRWLALDTVLPGVAATLERLGAAGWKLDVLTARRRADVPERFLEDLGLRGLVGRVVVVDPAAAERQKSDWLRRERPGAFIGDTESDAAAARAAGVVFVAVSTGQRDAGRLARLGCAVAADLDAASRLLEPG